MNIEIDRVRPSTFNPRKRFDVAELVESVKAKGIIEPLLVRPVGHDYEIVAGERRWRAAKEAGLETVPTVVRELSDQEALELALIENVQREDLTLLEEADGYARLQRDYGYTVEQLVEKTGKTKSTVYGRLKLCALGAEGRAALEAGGLTSSTALLVARVPGMVQAKAVEFLVKQGQDCEEPLSAREAARSLRHRFMPILESAPFGVLDEQLVPAAGSCENCLKRSGLDAELAPLLGANVCTDSGCYESKVDALYDLRIVAARKEGRVLLSREASEKIFGYGNSLFSKSHYADLDATVYDDPKQRKLRQLLDPEKVGLVVWVALDAGMKVRELVNREKADEFLHKTYDWSKKKAEKSSSSSRSSKPAPKKSAEEIEREKKVAKLTARIVLTAAKLIGENPKSLAPILRMAIHEHIENVYDDGGDDVFELREIERNGLDKSLAKMNERELAGLFLQLNVAMGIENGWQYDPGKSVATKFGIDVDGARKKAAAELAPKPTPTAAEKPARKAAPVKAAAKSTSSKKPAAKPTPAKSTSSKKPSKKSR